MTECLSGEEGNDVGMAVSWRGMGFKSLSAYNQIGSSLFW